MAWRTCQCIKVTTRGGIHRETDFFSICRLNLRCGNIKSCNGLGSYGRWHIPVVAAVGTPSKSYSAVSTVGIFIILSATAQRNVGLLGLLWGRTKKQLGPVFLPREPLADPVGSPGVSNVIRLMHHTYLHCLSVANGG